MSASNPSIQISKIFQSRKIVLELMETQDFKTNDYKLFNINEVNSMNQNKQLDMLLEMDPEKITLDNPNKKIYIHYYLSSRPSPKNIQDIIDDLFVLTETLNKKTDTLFIIIKDDANETLVNELKHIWESDGIFIVVENIQRLQFNILNHVLVPTHEIMTDSEVDEILKKYNITDKSLLPEISRFDPVAKAICLRPGQVCHIIRESKTAIDADYYRICI